MSIDYSKLLIRRSKAYLESAIDNFRKGRYDVASLEAEISAQLVIKAYIVYLGLEPPRTYSIRKLFAFIISERISEEDKISKVSEFIKENRKEIIILERAREAGQYGVIEVDKEEAEITLDITKKIHRLINELW